MRPLSGSYMPHVDGLRALAVLAVIFFHLDFAGFSGGYVGVDIFFVISGYLITRNIVGDLERGRFSFVNFYVRRARRLFPALFVTLLATFVAGVLLFSPHHLDRLGKSVMYSLLSVANFFFHNEVGYFDEAAQVKPLLHVWSLSVEEQFYLVWPLTLVLLTRTGRRWAPPLFLVAAALLSLALTERWLTSDPAAAFYLAPPRVLELGLGALMVWAGRHAGRTRPFTEPLAALGLGLALAPVVFYDAATPFPGLYALPPCIGTGLLIQYGTARWTGWCLRTRPVVAVGLISYSLYLIHWPLYVFYSYERVDELATLEKAALVAAAIGLATAMYRFVELPFRTAVRRPGHWRPRRLAAVCASLAVLLALPAFHAARADGWLWRLDADLATFHRDSFASPEALCDGRRLPEIKLWNCPVGHFAGLDRPLDVMLIGDSHAWALIHGFDDHAAARGLSGMALISHGVLPLRGTQSHLGTQPYGGPADLFAWVDRLAPRLLIVHGRFALHWLTTRPPGEVKPRKWLTAPGLETFDVATSRAALMQGLDNTVRHLEARGQPTLIIGSVPELGADPGQCYARPNYFGQQTGAACAWYTRDEALARIAAVNDLIAARVADSELVSFVDPADMFCRDTATEHCRIFVDGKSLYRDGNHLSSVGARYVFDHIAALIDGRVAALR